jgi:benzoyl-CoA reductase/2-hydroxyglutaryl-CoA dehydratase subunit BcrC/BadD/HgdB
MNTKRKLKAGSHLRKIMAEYYSIGNKMAREGHLTIWIAVGVPVEILRGFDAVVFVPENFSAVHSAKASAVDLAQKSENSGYSMDLCSYARISIGASEISSDDGKGLPKPDMLISCTNNCALLTKWFDVFHRELDIPHFVLDIPFCFSKQKEKDLGYILNQYKDLIRLLEKLSGKKVNYEKITEAQKLTYEAILEWKRFLNYASHRPSPLTAFDSFLHMGPIVALRGTQQTVDHNKLLADETEERLRTKKYPVPDEKFRLIWDNIAPWHQIKKMSARLKELKANLIYATYTSCIGTIEGEIEQFSVSSDEEFESMKWLARLQNGTVCPYGLELRFKAMSEMIKKFQINGVVFASNISCKPYSLMQMDLQRRIKKEFNIPSVLIDIDHADPRKYSEANTFTRIEALLETIENV